MASTGWTRSTPQRAHANATSSPKLPTVGSQQRIVARPTSALPALNSVLGALAAAGITEQDIWEGNEKVFPVYNSIKSKLDQLAVPGEVHTLLIHFNNMEGFESLGPSKIYKIEKDKPIWQIILSICKKCNVQGSRRYSLATLAGYVLDDNDCLGSFGFGSLLQHWELKLVKKTDEQYAQAKEQAAKSESYFVTILLPTVPAFQGVTQQRRKVKATTLVGEVVTTICKRHKANPEDFSLATLDDFILSKKEFFEFYGLGKKFDQMTFKLVSNPNQDRKPIAFNSEYAWAIVSDKLSAKDAKAVLVELDKQLGAAEEKSAQQKAEIEQLKAALLALNKVKKQVEEERDHVVGQAKKLVEVYTLLKGQQEDLLLQKDQNLKSIDTLKRELEKSQAELLAQQFDFEQQKLVLEQKVFSLEHQLQSERERLDSITADYKIAQDDIATLQAERNRLKDALIRVAADLKARKEVEEQLNYDIGKLQGEIAQRKFTESQLTQKLAVATSEQQRLSETVDQLLKDKSELSRKMVNLQSENEKAKQAAFQSQQEILALRSELEELRAKTTKELTEAKNAIAEKDKKLQQVQSTLQQEQERVKQLERESLQERSRLQAELHQRTEAFESQRRALEQKMADQLAQAMANKDSIQKEMTQTLTKLQQERDELAKAISKEKNTVRELEMKLKAAQDLSSKAEAQLQSIQSSRTDLEATVIKLQQTSTAQAKELEDLRLQFKVVNERNALLQRQEEQLQASLKTATERAHSLELEVQTLKEQITRSKGSSDAASHLQAALEKEQKSNIELQQKTSALEKKVKELESKLQITEKLLEDSRSEKEKLNSQLESIRNTTSHDKDATRELQQKLLVLQSEKEALAKQLEQLNQRLKESISAKLDVVEPAPPPPAAPAPPPAPKLPSSFTSTTTVSAPSTPQLSLEHQILSMKDALQKIDRTALEAQRKEQMRGGSEMANMIISGLERRFRLVKQNQLLDELEDLGIADDVEDDDWV